MKTYRVIYVPPFREDKEWIDVQANSIEEVKKKFAGMSVIDIREV